MTEESEVLDAMDRWPGYYEQSWHQRFVELDRRYNAMAADFANSFRNRPQDGGVVEPFLQQLRRVNLERCNAWVEGADAGIMFDAVELVGEVGELLNVVKKLEREERGWRGSRATDGDFADECADVLICLDKLARRRGVDLEAATIAKFDATSDKQGFPHRLSAPSPDLSGAALRAADAQTAGLVDTLSKWLRHSQFCDAVKPFSFFGRPKPCSCGLDAALAASTAKEGE